MRLKKESVLPFDTDLNGQPKIVREYARKYKSISEILDKNSWILGKVGKDLKKLSQGGKDGRKGVYTTENILRTIIVHFLEGESLRGTIIKIGTSEILQDFIRLYEKPVMDYSFLDKCIKAISPGTIDNINRLLGKKAVEEGITSPSIIRVKSTVVETNIRRPTDASLLWDTIRVMARLFAPGKQSKTWMHKSKVSYKKSKESISFSYNLYKERGK